MPVDHEQHRAEHDAVVLVELVPDCDEQILAGPGRIPVAPGRDRGAGPGKLSGVSSRYLTTACASLSRVPVSRTPAVKPLPDVAWKCCPVVTRRAVHRSTPGGMGTRNGGLRR